MVDIFDKPKSYHSGRGRGRPGEGRGLQAYLHVEAGMRATGLSVNAFCKQFPLFKTVLDRNDRRTSRKLSSDTLRRTYVRFKTQLKAQSLPQEIIADNPQADALERLVQELMALIRPR